MNIPAPCPGCGTEVVIVGVGIARLNDAGKRIGPFSQAQCGSVDKGCGYAAPYGNDIEDAIAKHNSLCRPQSAQDKGAVAWLYRTINGAVFKNRSYPPVGETERVYLQRRYDFKNVEEIPLYSHPAQAPVARDAEALAEQIIFRLHEDGYFNDGNAKWGTSKDLEAIILPIIRKHSLSLVSVPGWQWVPKEPTEEMLRAGNNARFIIPKAIYQSMLAAAPSPEDK